MKLNEKIGQFLYLTSKSRIPGLIMSDPGIGKTSTVQLYCDVMDINLTSLIASQYAPDDILGIQSVENGKLVRLAPAWFDELIEKSKNGKPNLLFIDELTTCDEFLQAPLLNLIFNQSLGIHKLPTNTHIVAAGNYAEQLNNSFKLTAPLVNRFLILNITSNDINVEEIIDNDLQTIIEKASDREKGEYLGLKKTSDCEELIRPIETYLMNNANFKVTISNSSTSGLIGFTSVRSISYALRYLKTASAEELVNDDLWQVLADTLGNDCSGKSWYSVFKRLDQNRTAKKSISSEDILSMSPLYLEELVHDLIKRPYMVSESIYRAISERSKNGDIHPELVIALNDALNK